MIDKIVVILNKKIEPGKALNAASHMVAALVNQANEDTRRRMKFMEFKDGGEQGHFVSALSLIVLRASNSRKINEIRRQAMDRNIHHTDFVETMTGDTYVEQMRRTREIATDDLNYYGVALFGSKATIDTLTSKLSLWR